VMITLYLATFWQQKNQIAYNNLWITDVIRIPRTTSSKQNCLSDSLGYRVGVTI